MEEKPKDEAGQKNNSCDFCGGPHDPGLCPEMQQRQVQQYWLITYVTATWPEKPQNAILDYPPEKWLWEQGIGKVLLSSLKISSEAFGRLSYSQRLIKFLSQESKTHARA